MSLDRDALEEEARQFNEAVRQVGRTVASTGWAFRRFARAIRKVRPEPSRPWKANLRRYGR